MNSCKVIGALLVVVSVPCPTLAAEGRCEVNELCKLLALDGGTGDAVGDGVSVSGNRAVIGAEFHVHNGVACGSAVVFAYDGSCWIQEDELLASDGAPGDRFGHSVSIDGDTIVVGTGAQAVYVFKRDAGNPGTWCEVQKITGAGGDFGHSVSLSGDTLVVGALHESPGGAAYVFERDQGGSDNWGQVAKLTPQNLGSGDQFGVSVSVSGHVVVVGAGRHDYGAPDAGAAYVFEEPPGGWNSIPSPISETAKLIACDAGAGDYFERVSISGNSIVIGAIFHDHDGMNDAGAAYIFEKPPGGWDSVPSPICECFKLTPSDASPFHYFGQNVAIDGDVAVVGAPGDDHAGTASGSGYVFWRDDNGTPEDCIDDVWIEAAKLTAADAAAGDQFAQSVSVDGSIAVVGARGDDPGGSAYTFHGLSDCNGNDTLDICDIGAGTSADSNGNGVADECEFVSLGIPLDIRPGSCPNPLNRNSHGVLPVALVGTPDFDVTSVDVASVRLARADGIGGDVAPNEGPPGPHSVFADVATPFAGEPCDCHELTGDAITDLSMKFRTDDMVEALELTNVPPGGWVELVVTGNLLDGTPFTSGTDCIRLVPATTPPANVFVTSNIPEAWADADPPDATADGGGFADFARSHLWGATVTLTAEPVAQGRPFVGWKVNGLMEFGDLTLDIALNEPKTVRAVYRSDVVGPLPGMLPIPSAPVKETDPVEPIEPR